MQIFNARVLDDSDQPVFNIEVVLVDRISKKLAIDRLGITDFAGNVQIPYHGRPLSVHLKSKEYWTTEVFEPRDGLDIRTSKAKIVSGPLDWWHQELLMEQYDEHAGKNIKIGIIDTGLSHHECLDHISYYVVPTEIIQGHLIAATPVVATGRHDQGHHGTAVCGLIGARPPQGTRNSHVCGIAPGADIVCVGIGQMNEEGEVDMHDIEIVEALGFLYRDQKCDLINMSLNTIDEELKQVLADQIGQAYDSGCLVICSAGNEGALPSRKKSNVQSPGDLPETVAVSALIRSQRGPRCEPSPFREKGGRVTNDGYYLANFSSRGKEVFCTAPGYVVAHIDERLIDSGYSYFEGTSFSAPLVTGALAARLSTHPLYSSLPRTRKRARSAKAHLKAICRRIDLSPTDVGHGMPMAKN